METGTPRLESLQVLRALAALLVCVAHLYGVDQRFFGGPALPVATQVGSAGVDLFFVLSGFLMVHVSRATGTGGRPVAAFLAARACRIYPMWWLALAAICLVGLVRPAWVFAHTGGVIHFAADFALWPTDRYPLLAIGWTLIHEVYFYLVFSLFLLLPRRWLPALLAAWMGVVGAGHAALTVQDAVPWVRLALHPLTLEFGLGALVGLLVGRGIRPAPRALVAAGLAWAGVAAVLSHEAPHALLEQGWLRVLAFGPAWALVVWGCVGREQRTGRVPARALVPLGDASYSLYLVHIAVFTAGARLLAPWCGPAPWDNVLAWLLLVGGSVLAGLGLHRWVEAPLLAVLGRWRRRLFARPGARPAGVPTLSGGA